MKEQSIIIEEKQKTVVAQWEPLPRNYDEYQSEAQLEKELIATLASQGYGTPNIHNETDMLANLRTQLEALNNIQFSDNEWNTFFKNNIACDANKGTNVSADIIEDCTVKVQQTRTFSLTRDDGSTKNIDIIDGTNPFRNSLQVINQYVPEGGAHANRYDVTILVNGLPLVHVELKRRGVNIKEAFNQINRYCRDSFWADSGLFNYVQIFVVSNGTNTRYYANTTRYAHIKEVNNTKQSKVKKEANSWEFTSYWADENNNIISDLADFSRTFFAKATLLNILTRYCVFTVDKNLMVMRPYQISATENILLRIRRAINLKQEGTRDAGGYIWHTTGSGKTLTSFKTAQLASRMSEIDKVLFVVDRRDLDYQTMKEYDNFQKDSANSNSNVGILHKQLNDSQCHIIITTIQKLSILLNKKDERYAVNCLDKRVVMIFDECHRSQFGDMHRVIEKKFKKYMIFGFTGTPIFAENCGTARKTTADMFGDKLHTYTIIDAIRDNNVLKFHIDYIRTMRMKDEVQDEQVWGIETEEALHDKRRITNNVKYVLDHYDSKTKRSETYLMSRIENVTDVVKKGKNVEEKKKKYRVGGFNSIFATDSVEMAIAYYNEFKKQMEERPINNRLKIATIFTYASNEEENEDCDGIIDETSENPENIGNLKQKSPVAYEALQSAIDDYNKMFSVNYSLDGDSFQNYYKDISLRVKNKEIDILIVVGMFLTGFDAKTLNTLWVDKNLKMHGLLQAYSRTNRILNSIKNCGNIVNFRNLEEETNKSLALFGDKDASGVVILRPFADYYYGFDSEDKNGIKHNPGYNEIVDELLEKFEPTEAFFANLDDEQKKDFVRLFGAFLKMQNLLSVFDEFTDDKKVIKIGQVQDFLSIYQGIREELKPEKKGDDTNINDDLVFEMELVKQIQVSIAYILELVKEYHDGNCADKEIRVKIAKAVKSSPDLRDKIELIQNFIDRMTASKGDVFDEWDKYVAEQKENELKAIIAEYNLKEAETREYLAQSESDGYISASGLGLAKVLPPMNPFSPQRGEIKAKVFDALEGLFNKYYEICATPTSTHPVVSLYADGTDEQTLLQVAEPTEPYSKEQKTTAD